MASEAPLQYPPLPAQLTYPAPGICACAGGEPVLPSLGKLFASSLITWPTKAAVQCFQGATPSNLGEPQLLGTYPLPPGARPLLALIGLTVRLPGLNPRQDTTIKFD